MHIMLDLVYAVQLPLKIKNNELQYKYFACAKEGFKVENKTIQLGKDACRKLSNTRVGCKASASVKRTNDGKYVLFTFHEEHNHTLCTPRKRHFLRSNRKVTDVQKDLFNTLGRVNIGHTQVCHIMKEQVGGYENVGFTCLDAKNYARDLKALIADSDAQILIQNFKKLQQKNPSFFYAYELDAENHLKCVFWSDEIARNNYSMFGDLLSFDTTYSTNKYAMIFASFTGLNHHRLSITFGAALLANEKTESFSWLFEKFLECMGGNEPVLVTDQDPAMRSALEISFKLQNTDFVCGI
ncbi:Protein FAR1-RELATED SEQUENCE 5 [Platanthera zijinensis]|uniref:Protein FAR1-RELATED SEQUENCE 5 n=1 Tax=Platanthera zijinensis TaxID=2320716 RepID=A0AAP0B2I3_9ASPA